MAQSQERLAALRQRYAQRLKDQQELVRQSQGSLPFESALSPTPSPIESAVASPTPRESVEPIEPVERVETVKAVDAVAPDIASAAPASALGASRATHQWRRPKASWSVLLFALLVHAWLLWLLAHYGPKFPPPMGSPDMGGSPAFSYTFRPIATVRLIDETADQAQGKPELPRAASTQLAVYSTNPKLLLEQTVTTTVPELTPERDPSEGAPTPQAVLKPSTVLSAAPVVPPLEPASAPEPVPAAPLAPTRTTRLVDGSSANQAPEPAALPRPALANTSALAAPQELPAAPAVPALVLPKSEPVRRNIASTVPQAPSAVEALRPVTGTPPAPTVAPLTIQITLPNIPAAPTPAPAPTAATPAVNPAASAVATPAPAAVPPVTGPPGAVPVQVIVNVPSGQNLPPGLPSTLNVPATGSGAGTGQGAGQGSGPGTGRGSAQGSGTGSGGSTLGGGQGTAPGGQPGDASPSSPGPGNAAGPRSPAASAPLNLQLPGRGPYASPQRQRSLADMANEQLRQGLANSTQIQRGVSGAAKPDCVSAERASASSPGSVSAVSAGGLLALPGLVWDAATGKCK